MGERNCVSSVPENEPAKFDPYPFLRESVSFGRYVSESLDWGKWSSFSQNRYLEEAENCSSRGSVAQMKAHFEDHYKKVAAKKAAALLEQENLVSEIGKQGCGSHLSFSVVHEELELVENDVIAEQLKHAEVGNQGCVREDSKLVQLDVIAEEQLKDADIVVDESSTNMEHEFAEAKQNVTLDSVDVLNVSLEEINPYKQTSPPQNQAPSEPLVEVENIEKDEMRIDRNIPLHKSPLKENFTYTNQDNLSSSDTKRKSTKSRSPFFKSTSKSIPPSPETTSKKCTKDNNKSTVKIPQMFPSSSCKAERAYQISSKPSPNARSTRFSCFKLSDVSNSHITSTKQSPGNMSKHFKKAPLLSEKRNISNLQDGKAGSRNGRLSVSDFGKTSINSYRNSSASPQSASLFCFWSKERAERRKEHILKMEEKLSAQRLERAAKNKQKAEDELKILRQSLGFKARPMPDFYHKRDAPTTEGKKVDPSQAQHVQEA